MYSSEHYIKYPNLRPWVGEKYGSKESKNLLIIGESHYLPADSVAAQNPEEWYSKNQSSLSESEKSWIHTSGIINNNIKHNFPKKGHSIYRNIAREINENHFNYKNSAEIFNHVAYMNYFQRPAEVAGGSINIKAIDKAISESVVSDVLNVLNPDLIIICSNKAGKFASILAKKKGIPFVVSPHPACRWWNDVSNRYGGTGKEVIKNFLTNNQWVKSS